MVDSLRRLFADDPHAAPVSWPTYLAAMGFFLCVTILASILLLRMVSPAGDAALNILDHERDMQTASETTHSSHARVQTGPALKP